MTRRLLAGAGAVARANPTKDAAGGASSRLKIESNVRQR
jgi:hypothetical protein